jgi:hypothetical protein
LGKWNQVTYVYSGSVKNAKIYLNGKPLPVAQNGGWVAAVDVFNTLDSALTIGRVDQATTLAGSNFDNIRIYNRALSASEVSQLYARDSGKSRYALIKGNFTWDEAKADAEARGGHLATITTEAENKTLISSGILESTGGDFYSPQNLVWIGATDSETEGIWKWITGEPWGFTSWGLYEPSDSGGLEDAALIQIHKFAGFWNDAPRDWRGTYLLEIEGPEEMISVQGGMLPQGSGLSGQMVGDFQIGKYEVTWGEWKTVRAWAAANGYDIGTTGQGTADDHPVRDVNWYDVLKWCNAKV